VQIHDQGSETAKDKSDIKLTTIPMSGSLTGAHYTTLDQDDSEVDFDTANGQVLKFKNAQGYANAHNPDVFVGDTEDGTATVDMVKEGKDIFASIVNTVTNTITQIGPDANDNLVVTETSTNDYPEDAPPQDTGEPDDFLLLEQGSIQVRDHEGADDGSLLDVLVVWTHYAECKKSGLPKGCTHTTQTEANIKGTIKLAIQESNTAFELSQVHTDLRLVHMYRDTEGFDEAAGYSDALNKITGKTDGVMDSVHSEREKYKADVVVLIIQNSQYCGMAWLGPSKDRMFSVTGWNCATGYYSFAHEIMHNLGCNHDRGTSGACSSTSSNYGYRDPAGQFRSIMGYNCRTGQCDQIKKNGCPRVQRVSNPAITYQGKAMGTATANNAKRINDVRKIVAQYYDSAARQSGYFLADGGTSCDQACQKKGEMCDANSLKNAAASVATCKKIIESLGKTPQRGGQYGDDNAGCTYHPGQTGWYQVMRRDGDPGCSVVNRDRSRQRVCSCNKQAPTTAPCNDKYSQCPGWANYYCTGRWASWMATNCPKSCSKCS